MAEVLSQSQIDALLNAARNGEINPTTPAEKNPEEQYRKYDFYSPRKFTTDRLKMISSIFENYTRIIASMLNGMLHTTCEIEVESVEEQRYYEFSNVLTDGDVLTLVDVTPESNLQVDENPILFYFEKTTMLGMIDRLMGGDGRVNMENSAGYNYTELELKLYETVTESLVSVLGRSWGDYIDIDYEIRRTETNPTLVQLMGLDETIVIIDIKISFPNNSGRMTICFPGLTLANIFAQISSMRQHGKGKVEDNSETILDILRDSTLDMTGELGRTMVSLRDIYYLHVGDVIDLGHPVSEPVSIYVGGQKWFNGKMGSHGKNVAIKISETYHDQGR